MNEVVMFVMYTMKKTKKKLPFNCPLKLIEFLDNEFLQGALPKNYWQVFIDHPDPKKRYGYDPDHDFLLIKEDIEEDSLQFHNPYWNVPPRFTVVPYDWGWLENSENWDHHHIFYVFNEMIRFLNDHRNMIDKFLNQRKV